MSPQFQLILQQGIQAFQVGNFDMACSILKRIIQIDKKNLIAFNTLGLIKALQGDFKEATFFLAKAASINPNDAAIQYNLAKALSDSGDDKSALAHHKKAVALDPNNQDAWLNYGLSEFNLGCYEAAITLYDKALSLRSDYAEAWSNKGNAFCELKKYDEAIKFYDRALSLKPDFAEAWSNKGNLFLELKRFDQAIELLDNAINLRPLYANAWSNKGVALNELGRYEEAIAHFSKALSIKKSIDWLAGDLLHLKMRICSWSDLSNSLDEISKKILANEKVINPFKLLPLTDDSLIHKKNCEIYVENKCPKSLILGELPKRLENEKIRIGYFSFDFRMHAVSILIAELFELHDKNKFEIIAFSFGDDDKSHLRSRISNAVNRFIDVRGMTDLDIAKLSRELSIDIAIDLGGHTAGARTNIFAYRAAPIQVSYLGYLGTMGAEYIDYILADTTIIPVDSQKFYVEKVAYLPSYQVNDRRRQISDKQFTRSNLSLPEKGFIFCCFNNNYKILPATFDGWMRILKAVEGSCLFLYAENEWVKQNLKKEAFARGVDGERLVFGKHIPIDENLARYKVCDLFLDTFPYNAGTSASDALWAGLPVLTLMGQSFASRMAASVLNAIGLPELIANTQEKYESLAIELAMNPEKLANIKNKLEAAKSTAPLFDTPLFTQNLEAIYIKMIDRYRADIELDHILIG